MQNKISLSVVAGFLALAAATAAGKPAEASSILNVVYSNGAIDFGPLSSDLGGVLPGTVNASFLLGEGQSGLGLGIVQFPITSVIAADMSFGDGTWTVNELTDFLMQVDNGAITGLLYTFAPITTATVVDRLAANFPLTITGTDIASGQPFQYTYASSTQTLTAVVPEPATLFLFLVGLPGLRFIGRRRRVA